MGVLLLAALGFLSSTVEGWVAGFVAWFLMMISILGIHPIRTVPTLQDVRVRKPCFVVEVFRCILKKKSRFPETFFFFFSCKAHCQARP